MKIKYLISFLASLLLALLLQLTSYDPDSASFVYTASYFVLTLWLLSQYGEDGHEAPIAWLTAAGLCLPLTALFVNYQHTDRLLLFSPLLAMVSILLAAVYHHHREETVLILSVAILLLLNVLGPAGWLHVAG